MLRKLPSRILDIIVIRPLVDLVLFAAILLASHALITSDVITDIATRNTVYTTVAAFSGIILAASTFSCGLLYSSTSELVRHVRKIFARELRSNWTAILLYCFAAGLLSICGFILDQTSLHLGNLAVVGALVLLSLAMFRVIYWTRYVLFSNELDALNHLTTKIPYASSDSTDS